MLLRAITLSLLVAPRVWGLLLSMHKPNGEPDHASIISHIDLIENTLTTLQSQMLKTTTELTTVKSILATTEGELVRVKSELKLSQKEIAILKVQSKPQNVHINLTAIDALGEDIKTNTREVLSLKSSVATNGDIISNITASVAINQHELVQLRTEVGRTDAGELHTLNSRVATARQETNKTNVEVEILWSMMGTVTATLNTTESDLKTLDGNLQMLETNTTKLVKSLQSELVEITQQMNNTNSEVATIHSSVSRTASELQYVKQKVEFNVSDIADSLRALAGLQSDVVSNLSQLVHSVSEKHSSLQDQIAEDLTTINKTLSKITSQIGTIVTDVGFYVHGPTHSTGTSRITFTHVDYNKGQGYNQTAGVFLAPVAGTYLFWANVQLHYAGSVYLFVYQGSRQLVTTHINMSGNDGVPFRIPTVIVVTHVNRGEEVRVATDFKYNGVGPFSSFGGTLLHADSV